MYDAIISLFLVVVAVFNSKAIYVSSALKNSSYAADGLIEEHVLLSNMCSLFFRERPNSYFFVFCPCANFKPTHSFIHSQGVSMDRRCRRFSACPLPTFFSSTKSGSKSVNVVCVNEIYCSIATNMIAVFAVAACCPFLTVFT